jgi:hypothetical protein
MSVLSKIFLNWHAFRIRYHELLLDSCLCSVTREKLNTKITYHRIKKFEIYRTNVNF